MKHSLLTARLTLAAVVAPGAANAQRAPAAVVVVVEERKKEKGRQRIDRGTEGQRDRGDSAR